MSVKARIDQKIAEPETCFPLLLVDAHVHIHECFELDTFLSSAWDNFNAEASERIPQNASNNIQESTKTQNFTGVLLLTETAKDHWFKQIASQIDQQLESPLAVGEWAIAPTAEAIALTATQASGKQLIVIAGHQIVTSEKLEVLSLINGEKTADGQPLAQTIQAIQASGGIAVLPWGVGKWLGKRGQQVADLIASEPAPAFFLGDNSGRPQFWRRPPSFEAIEQKGRQVLPGTDPLPLPTEAARPGRFGLAIAHPLDPHSPAQSLKQLFLQPNAPWKPYGKLETPVSFLRNQLAIRTQKA